MFESTLEAQGPGDDGRRLGTLSAAALAHLGIVMTIVAVTALVVPPVHTPDAPPFVIVMARGIPEEALAPPRPPAPTKGTDAATPGKMVAPPRRIPDAPNRTEPDVLPPSVPDTAPEGPEGAGAGTPGDPEGSPFGVPGGAGRGESSGGDGPGSDPVFLTGDMMRPVLLEKVEPSYPQAARRAGLGGRVTVRAVIAEDGAVETVEVLASTNPLFNEAAVVAVRKWRYRPALMNGRPVRVYFSVVVDFLVR